MKNEAGYSCFTRILAVFILSSLIAGCASYSKQTAETLADSKAGQVDAALASLESKNTSKDKDLLYYLEKGELLRQKGSFSESRDTWLAADLKVRQWEDDARTDPSKLMGEIGSVILNDTTRRYDGRDYEKVMLSVRLAHDHVANGDWDAARTEIKKMHEREAIIADFRAKELEKAVAKANEKGIQARSYRDLNGYPIETLDDPAVRGLKNSYESAYANYLAGFIYEALNEPSLAAPGYRKAAEMQPNNPTIDAALSGLDSRIVARHQGNLVETLIVIEAGNAPEIKSVTLPLLLPMPSAHGIQVLATPLSWPVVRPEFAPPPSVITVDDQTLPVTTLTDINVMARRAIADEMPGIITRSAIRAITRGATQAAIDAAGSNQKNGNAQLASALIGLFVKIASVATEVADERIWRTLPGNFSIARVTLPPGTHHINIGSQTKDVELGGQYALVDMRVLGSNTYLAASYTGTAVTPPPVSAVSETVAAVEPPPKKSGTPKKAAASKKSESQTKSLQPKAAPATTNDATAKN